MMDSKQEIRDALASGKQTDGCLLREMIENYEEKNPYDLELYVMKIKYCLLWEETERAYRLAGEAVRKNPYHYDVNLCMRDVCERMGEYDKALKYDIIAEMLKGRFRIVTEQESRRNELEEKLEQEGESLRLYGTKEQKEQYRQKVNRLIAQMKTVFGFKNSYGKFGNTVIGKFFEDPYGNRKYGARYNDIYIPQIYERYHLAEDSILCKSEYREVSCQKEYTVGEECEYLLPVLSEKENVGYTFTTKDGKRFFCKNKEKYHFNYYRLLPGTKLVSDQMLYIGNPIALTQDPKKKKLVLNIFLDGFSQKVVEEEGLENLMPYTNQFFSKGIHCGNAYTAGEWTLPSIASYVSGLTASHHHLIHDGLTYYLPEDVTVLQEYFKEAGYQTAKIDGDWRSNQVYGYGRGMDRILYQNQHLGMRADRVVADVIDHMDLMMETNQFIWMCIGDLHDVADGFELRASVQASVPLSMRKEEGQGETSVKQDYSLNKRMAYVRQMKYVDRHLNLLYQHIERNYQDQDIIVSLFGDHGQGYLVGKEEHFLAEGRSKVGMLFRGGFEKKSVCNELISTCDYVSIMCRLAGIPMKEEETDGNLPVFFGGQTEREYVMTESIHPGDPYRAAVVSKDGAFYFTSEGLADYDGRVALGSYRYFMHNSRHEVCEEQSTLEKYRNIVLNHIREILIYGDESGT